MRCVQIWLKMFTKQTLTFALQTAIRKLPTGCNTVVFLCSSFMEVSFVTVALTGLAKRKPGLTEIASFQTITSKHMITVSSTWSRVGLEKIIFPQLV
jgi:hypothetical protein